MTKPKPKFEAPAIGGAHDDPTARNLPKSAKTVTVCCKYPHGLLLRVFEMREVNVQTRNGTEKEKQAFQVGETIKINGPIAPARQASIHEVAGGYAMTHNVPAEPMQEWMRQNADLDVVKNGLIFVAPSRGDGRDRAEEHADVKTNVEPLAMPMRRGEKVTDKRVLAMGGGGLEVAERPGA
jgi:hypothetical protein